MKYTLKSKHWSQLNQWAGKTISIEFGDAGIEELNKMRSSREYVKDVGAVSFDPGPGGKIGDIFEEHNGVDGYIYHADDGSISFITKYKDDHFYVEGNNDYFVTDNLDDAEAWLFYSFFLESPDREFSMDETDPGHTVFLSSDNRILWTEEN